MFDLKDDDDLEAMQQEFLGRGDTPAARVVRRAEPPAVLPGPRQKGEPRAPAVTAETGKAAPAEKSVDEGDMLGFARRMKEAIADFEVKERAEPSVPAAMPPPAPPANTQASRPAKKKLSLFAQRQLAKQRQAGAGTAPDTGSSGAPSCEATFLPKLMAPVPEHQTSGPVEPPQQRPRDTGFPEIPSIYPTASKQPQANEPIRATGGDAWADIRGQISQENEDRIRGMSGAEVQEAVDEVRSTVSEETLQRLARLRQRRQNADGAAVTDSRGSTPTTPAVTESKENGSSRRVRFAETEVEPDVDSHNDDAGPPPPPPAEWVDAAGAQDSAAYFNVDDNSTGTDSEFYRDMKRKYFPSEVVEEAKLAWILGHRQAKSPMEQAVDESRRREAQAAAAAASGAQEGDLLDCPASKIRFAFDGQILGEAESDIPTHHGLHHHGEDPDKPGYTIPELLHLSRSTVPAQRSVAVALLGRIIHKVNVGAWDTAQSVEVFGALLSWQFELYLVQGISDASMTGRTEAAIALWTWIVEMTRYKALVRLAGTGSGGSSGVSLPGADINLQQEPVAVAEGELVERAFKALDAALSTKFMDVVLETIDMSLLPDRQLTMLAECIKALSGMSQEFNDRIKAHGRLPILLQNKYPYLMGK
ncbi:hypothetical protein GGF46_004582 [Coemansia sp. RSA 552]|nr:hypothetical protein GGF46_004582 [Coemansia sp. RSA 552]